MLPSNPTAGLTHLAHPFHDPVPSSDCFVPKGDGSSVVFQISTGCESNLNQIYDKGRQRRQWEGDREEHDESELNDLRDIGFD